MKTTKNFNFDIRIDLNSLHEYTDVRTNGYDVVANTALRAIIFHFPSP